MNRSWRRGGRWTPKSLAVVAVLSLIGGSLGAGIAEAVPARLSFGACPDGSVPPGRGVECAVVDVPMDHAEPDGPSIEVTVSRIAATGARRGAIFANPGGPGADTLDYWAVRNKVLPAELGQHYDRIAVQPRGLRWSTPLHCAIGTVDDSEDAGADDDRVAPGSGARDEIRDACDSAHPRYLRTITTENTARDMDAVRAALGFERIDFLGTSYGTYLGAVYASLFPERVDRMVLDSNVHPKWVWTEQFAQQQLAGKKRLDDLFGWIAAHHDEYRLGDTALRVYENWVRLVVAQGGGWYANLTPPPASGGDLPGELPEPLADLARAGFDGSREQVSKVQNLIRALLAGGMSAQVPLLSATSVASYTRAFWPKYADAMAEASIDPTNVGPLLDLAGAGSTDPTGRNVFAAITCNENAVPGRTHLLAAAVGTIASGGNALDARADLVRSGLACTGWDPVARPVPITGQGLRTPPLLLQSRHDALTKYEGAPALARALGGALITVDGGDHGTFGRGNPAVDEAVMTYLRTGEITRTRADQAPLSVR